MNNTQQYLIPPEVPAVPSTVPTWAILLGELTVDNFSGTTLQTALVALNTIAPTSANHIGCSIIKIAHTVDSLGGRISSTWINHGHVTMDIGLGRGHHAEISVEHDGYVWMSDNIDHWNEGDGTLSTALRLIRKYYNE